MTGESKKTTLQGTSAWMAPEVMGDSYSFQVDVFSFGMVMFELLTCKIPWVGSQYRFSHQILMAAARGERPSIDAVDLVHVPTGFVALMERCWETDPMKRPSFVQVLLEVDRLESGVESDGLYVGGEV